MCRSPRGRTLGRPLDLGPGEERLELGDLVEVAGRQDDPVTRRHRRLGARERRAPRPRPGRAGRRARRARRCALGGGLHLHERPRAGHDHVHVRLGARVLDVGQVEQRQAVDHATLTAAIESAAAALERAARARARRGPGAAPPRRRRCWRSGCRRRPGGRRSRANRALAERLHVDHGPQRAADEALDLRGAPVGPAAGDVARLAVAGRGGEHPVLGRHPAAAPAAHPGAARPRPPRRCRSPRVRPTEIRALPWAVSTKPGQDLDRPQLVRGASVGSHRGAA